MLCAGHARRVLGAGRRLRGRAGGARRWCAAGGQGASSGGRPDGGGGGRSSGGGGGSSAEDAEVSPWQKWQHFLACAVPMIGFGAMDNTIMIHAGDLIDNFFGTYLRFTLVAAAFGQLFSDVSGVLFGGTVEALAAKCGFEPPELTKAQRGQRSIRLLGTLGAALGVMLGCCLGMVNLLFLDLEKAERLKQAEKMRSMFEAIIAEGWELMNCDRCTLYLLSDLTRAPGDTSENPDSLFTMVRHGVYPTRDELEGAFEYATGKSPADRPNIRTDQLAKCLMRVGWEPKRVAQMLPDSDELTYTEFTDFMSEHLVQEQCTVPLRQGGTKWHVVSTGEVLNLPDVYADDRFKHNRLSDLYSGYQSRSILIGPVKDASGKVIGLVELINKFGEYREEADGAEVMAGLEIRPFTEEDEKMLHMMCAHCATFIEHVMGTPD